MTSRTNGHSVGRNQGGSGEVAPADLEYRRQLAEQAILDTRTLWALAALLMPLFDDGIL